MASMIQTNQWYHVMYTQSNSLFYQVNFNNNTNMASMMETNHGYQNVTVLKSVHYTVS